MQLTIYLYVIIVCKICEILNILCFVLIKENNCLLLRIINKIWVVTIFLLYINISTGKHKYKFWISNQKSMYHSEFSDHNINIILR